MRERVAWATIIWKVVNLLAHFFFSFRDTCGIACCALTGMWVLGVRITFLHPKRELGT